MPKNQLSLRANADLELQHILLEIESGRAHHLRHFVDQWYCYQHSLVSRYGNADWDLIFDDYPRTRYSVSAQKEQARAASLGNKEWWKSPSKFGREHTIPLQVITDILLSLSSRWDSYTQQQKLDEIELALKKLLVFSIIADFEDKLLSSNGLKQSMPKAWDATIKPTLIQNPPTNWKAFDQFARYRGLIAPWIP